MTDKEKQLLLKDLCARLPYGIKILHEGWNYEWDDELSTVERVVGIDENFIYTKVIDTHNGEEYRDDKYCVDLFDDKLFLRPMSSMTEEEMEELLNIDKKRGMYSSRHLTWHIDGEIIDYLNKKMFDWRGLIPMGLALEAPEGMYKI